MKVDCLNITTDLNLKHARENIFLLPIAFNINLFQTKTTKTLLNCLFSAFGLLPSTVPVSQAFKASLAKKTSTSVSKAIVALRERA